VGTTEVFLYTNTPPELQWSDVQQIY